MADRRRPRAGRERRRVRRLGHVHDASWRPGRCRRSAGARGRGGAGGRPARSAVVAPQVTASVRARSSSSASRSAARSRRRLGSTSTTSASGGQQVGEQALVGGEPRQPALHAVEDQALGEPLPVLAAPRLVADQLGGARPHLRRGQQLAGREDRAPRRGRPVERWSFTENVVRRSTSSPHRSMRTGASAVDGKTSTIEPRRATSPRCSTSSSRR